LLAWFPAGAVTGLVPTRAYLQTHARTKKRTRRSCGWRSTCASHSLSHTLCVAPNHHHAQVLWLAEYLRLSLPLPFTVCCPHTHTHTHTHTHRCCGWRSTSQGGRRRCSWSRTTWPSSMRYVHAHTLSHILSLIYSLSLFLSLPLSLSPSLPRLARRGLPQRGTCMHILSLSFTHFLSLSYTHSLSYTRPHSFSLMSHDVDFPKAVSPSLTRSLAKSLTK
jgi:hypothetical protein